MDFDQSYQNYLFGDKCLYELPTAPQLHILATNVNEGCLCSFTRRGMLVQHRLANGALEVIKHFPDAISIFILPRSRQHLVKQLTGRGTEDEEATRHRLDRVEYELKQAEHYRHHVTNETVDQAVSEICDILKNYND